VMGSYCSFGNFAPFYEIGISLMLDGIKKEVFLLPLLIFNFYFYMWAITQGFFDSIWDLITKRKITWAKTARFAGQEQGKETTS
ncbi:MAG: glycosyltransferase family 2 protein, partial [Lachnospiraceae bacterium]|nr:glycosyltransferase family 2 protein [Lachnospiraceae bacterium]